MCFHVDPVYKDSFIASKNITVYKVGEIHWLDSSVFSSLYQQFQYDINENQKIVKLLNIASQIEAGYHSYNSFKVARERANGREAIGKFVIPKGSIYWVNPCVHERVSNQIIFKGFVNKKTGKLITKRK